MQAQTAKSDSVHQLPTATDCEVEQARPFYSGEKVLDILERSEGGGLRRADILDALRRPSGHADPVTTINADALSQLLTDLKARNLIDNDYRHLWYLKRFVPSKSISGSARNLAADRSHLSNLGQLHPSARA